MSDSVQIKRALLSVSDKTHLDKLALFLHQLGVEIISTGGTATFLKNLNIPMTPIEQVTHNPEAFGGRIKTLSFQIMSSLLFRRQNSSDLHQAQTLGIAPIDLVVCNLYPFEQAMKAQANFEELIENIDIGGPTMIRAAAKNMDDVLVCVDPLDYDQLIHHLNSFHGCCHLDLRKQMALKAFQMTAHYDSLISATLEERLGNEGRQTYYFKIDKNNELRYGENPHQKAYTVSLSDKGLINAKPLQGKSISYNNFLDADAALRSCADIKSVAPHLHCVTIIKHSNPCGAAACINALQALKMAWASDPISSFGGILCLSCDVTQELATWLSDKFVEVILAPSFSLEAKQIFASKKNLRLLELPIEYNPQDMMFRSLSGGLVIQQEDYGVDQEFSIVTQKGWNSSMLHLARFGAMVTKHLRSNAIALFYQNESGMAISGAGMGNPNRLISHQQAFDKARQNNHTDLSSHLLVSDAFFPFADNIELANEAGIRFIVQPGGSIKDSEVINACDRYGITMAFTKRRHFRH